jgi:hypothetical protein
LTESVEPAQRPRGSILLIMGISTDALGWPDYFVKDLVDGDPISDAHIRCVARQVLYSLRRRRGFDPNVSAQQGTTRSGSSWCRR